MNLPRGFTTRYVSWWKSRSGGQRLPIFLNGLCYKERAVGSAGTCPFEREVELTVGEWYLSPSEIPNLFELLYFV